MGQKPSVSRLPSREDLLQKKSEGRVIINMIFSWLKEQASFQDLLLLGNPHKCSEYIFLTAEALRQVFDVLRVYPEKDQRGVIYFKKIDDIKKSQADYRPLCMQIAFFYIRIFQVFGALAISVMDVDPVLTTAVPGQLVQGLGAPWVQRPALAGGAVPPPTPNDILKILYPLLDLTEYEDYYKFSGTEIYVLKRMAKTATSGTFKVSHQKQGLQEVKVDFRLTRYESTRYVLEVVKAAPRKPAFEPVTLREDPFSGEFLYDSHNIKYFVKKYVEEIEGLLAGKAKAGQGAAAAIEQPFVQAGLQAKHILDSFNKPPKAHCVARALQLLSNEGLLAKAPSTAYTRMCDPVFFTDNLSLPRAEQKISDEIGIFVLNQLFYDTLSQMGAKMGSMAQQKYNEYLRDLKVVFEDLPLEQRESLRVETIADIKNKIPRVCKSGQPLMQTSHTDTIREVRKIAAQMLWFQIEHTAEVTKILGKLFKLPLKRGEKVDLHPEIYKQGIQGVNRVADEARALLMRYYKKCETLYRMGTTIYETRGNLRAV